MTRATSEFLTALAVLGGLAALGAARFRADPRFRVRHRRPASPALRRVDRAFWAALAATTLGFVLMLAFMTGAGGPATGRAGQVLAVAGFLALLAAGGVALRETFRARRGRRRSGSRPVA